MPPLFRFFSYLRAGLFWLGASLPLVPALAQTQPKEPDPTIVPSTLFNVPEGLEVTVWAHTPLLHNPTNMDFDQEGRLWATEGVNYRRHQTRQPVGDRVVILEDKDGDGRADTSSTFVQEPGFIAPLGLAVLGD